MYLLHPGGSGGGIECTVCGKRWWQIARLTIWAWTDMREHEAAHDS